MPLPTDSKPSLWHSSHKVHATLKSEPTKGRDKPDKGKFGSRSANKSEPNANTNVRPASHPGVKNSHQKHVNPLDFSSQHTQELCHQLVNDIKHDKVDSVRSLINKYPELVFTKNDKGETPVHHAALKKDTEHLKILLTVEGARNFLLVKNDSGYVPLHNAVLMNHPETVKSILQFEEGVRSLQFTDIKGISPCKIALLMNYTACLKLLLEHEPALDEIRNIRFSMTRTEGEQTSAILQAQKKHPLPFRPVLFNHTAAQTDIKAIPEIRAKNLIKGLATIEVYTSALCQPGETSEVHFGYGDESFSIRVIEELMALGARELYLRLAPPDNSAADKRKAYTPGQRLAYEEKLKVALSKLAHLLPAFNPKQGIPQEIRLQDCKVNIIGCDDPETKAPLIISFLTGNIHYKNCGWVNENFMVLRPFRYYSSHQMLLTDVQEDRVNRIPLNLPVNSIIPEKKPPKFDQDNADHEKQWMADKLQSSGNNPALAETIGDICFRCRSGQIHHGLVYGLHHPEFDDQDRENILNKWLNILKMQSEKSSDNKPVLVSISRSTMESQLFRSIAIKHNIPFIDPLQAESKNQLDALVQHGGVGLCLQPSLPKPVFLYLITTSDFPMLVEGANTTAFVLQTGLPYLSVLPTGNTLIPRNMGNPLEALKAEAFSYKLLLNADEYNALEKLTGFLKAEEYARAADYIEQRRSSDNLKHLSFLWQTPEISEDTQDCVPLNVMSLLEKGKKDELGHTEKKALISIVDPSENTFYEYVAECLKSESVTTRHFHQQSNQVNQPCNNKLISALNRFADIKKL